jgi:hypothetical protein
LSSEKAATAAVAAIMPIMGIGQVGRSLFPIRMPASRGSASATVGRCAAPSPERKDATSATGEPPSTGTPVTVPSWLTIMMTAIPAM